MSTRRRKLDAGDLAAEILRRCERADRSGYVVSISNPITAGEIQLAAARIQRRSIAIVPAKFNSVAEWVAHFGRN
jgi:hypothetical protein